MDPDQVNFITSKKDKIGLRRGLIQGRYALTLGSFAEFAG